MNKIVIVGGSRGIGKEIINQLVQDNMIINLSRNKPELTHTNLTHHNIDILSSDLPDLEDVSSVIYCPGSINLKPIGRISLDEFREDFEINVVGAIKLMRPCENNSTQNNPPVTNGILRFKSMCLLYVPHSGCCFLILFVIGLTGFFIICKIKDSTVH